MGVIIGSARVDERGKYANGAAGDQKSSAVPDFKGEVSMENFYVHPQGWYVLRANDDNIANKIAESMKRACNNPNVGYDQYQRLGIITYGTGSTVKTECDCSSLVRQCVKEASGKDVGNFTTANEASVLINSGMFRKLTYTSKTTLYTGDILVTKTQGHTVVVVEGYPRNSSSQPTPVSQNGDYYPKYTGNTSSITSALAAVGETNTSLTNRAKIAAKNGINGYTGTAAQNTKLLNLLKQGKLLKITSNISVYTPVSVNYYPKYNGSSSSITAALKAVGEKDTSLNHRKKIAVANKINNYSGTSAQNIQMVNLLKQGKLIKA